MHGNRQSRLRLKAKERNGHALYPPVDDNQQSSAFRLSNKSFHQQNDEAFEGGPCFKKRLCEYENVNRSETGRSGQKNDDVVMISDDEVENGVRNHISKVEITRPKTEDLTLMKLREQLVKIRSHISCAELLEDLPAFTNAVNVDNTRETNVDGLISDVEQQLSPLPEMCSWCQKRKPVCFETFNSQTLTKNKNSQPILNNYIKSDLVQKDKSQIFVCDQTISEGNHRAIFLTKDPDKNSSQTLVDSKWSSTTDKKPAGKERIASGGHFQTSYLTKHTKKHSLVERKRINSNSNKMFGNKINVSNYDLTGNRRLEAEIINVNRKTCSSEERGDNLLLRLSSNVTGSTGVESFTAGSRGGITNANNSRHSTSDELGVMKMCGKSVNNEPSNMPKGDKLKSCPLCQMKFENGMCQVDLDGHIAGCFASAEDDVIW